MLLLTYLTVRATSFENIIMNNKLQLLAGAIIFCTLIYYRLFEPAVIRNSRLFFPIMIATSNLV